MSTKYTQSFKEQAVEKVLNCAEGTSQNDVAATLGIAKSTLSNWIDKSRENKFESKTDDEGFSSNSKNKEKRLQDWSLEERLTIIMECHSLDKNAMGEHCRKHGIYTHHLTQWKQAFMSMNSHNKTTKHQTEIKVLKAENKTLKKELNRKEKALAETAALLVLKKKVHEIWGTDEDNLP